MYLPDSLNQNSDTTIIEYSFDNINRAPRICLFRYTEFLIFQLFSPPLLTVFKNMIKFSV
nr:MAG TPA: hypothetical protein [Caudoviricetes sp.]